MMSVRTSLTLPRRLAAAMMPALMLAGCGAADDDPGIGGVSAGEARALNDAAAMLDRNAPPVPPSNGPLPPPANAATPQEK